MRTVDLVFALLVGSLVWGGAACSGQPADSDFWLVSSRSVETTVVALPDDEQVAFGREPVRELLLDEIGQISQVRVWKDTIVGIVDLMACQAVLLSIAGEEVRYLRRFGACGDGPAEFREPADLFLDGDTLIVVDLRDTRITFLPLESGESREVHIPRVTGDPWAPLEILTADTASVVLLASLPGAGVSARANMVRRIRRDDAALLSSGVPDAPFSGSNPAVLPRRLSACWDPETDRIVVANRWRAERLIVDRASYRVIERHVSSVPWIEAVEPFDDNGGVAAAAYVRMQCGDGFVLILWRGRPRTPYADRYLMELVGTDGAVHLLEHGKLETQQHPARLGIAGRTRDGWVLYTNLDPAGPKLYVFDWSPPASP
ncbi:MAG TPA: hypothetical protein VMM17_09170 [Gemmatimonadaceae bacterium]|nr:hypothetical protein [Gemmatimonadaceae bacterium]